MSLTSIMMRLRTSQRGGVALIMLIGFIALAVPLTIASIQTGSQLSRNSRVYDSRLTGMYNSGSAIEVALHDILSDPDFDDGLTPGSPSKPMTADANGETVDITVTKIFTTSAVDGQGVVVSKAVMPTSTPVNTPTTFTYTITFKNEGTGTSELIEVKDFLPPGFTYVTSSTSGITTNDPIANPGAVNTRERFLNDDIGGPPDPWEWPQGSDQKQANIMPPQSVWTEVSQYWETATYSADGTIPATTWDHRQWILAAGDAKWRWKVQRVRGGTPTTMFTSADGSIDTSWAEKKIGHNPGEISIQSGDKLRLYLEVWSPESTPGGRIINYRWGGSEAASPAWNSRTTIPRLSHCGDGTQTQYELAWDLIANVPIQSQEELTLTFQATGSLPNGTYYNQAELEYDASWGGDPNFTYSPNQAAVTVGTGTPKCSNLAEVMMSKVVDSPVVDAGEPTTLTYIVTFENTIAFPMWLCQVSDWLPPGFDYNLGGPLPTGDIDRHPHALHFEDDEQRYRAHWKKDQWPENSSDYILSIGAGVTKSFSFEVTATLEQGINYFNEIDAQFSNKSDCDDPTATLGGASGGASTAANTMYDVAAVAADGTVKARVLLWTVDGTIDILSWQEN